MRAKTQRSKATALLAVIAAIAMVLTLFAGSVKPAFAADATQDSSATVSAKGSSGIKIADTNSGYTIKITTPDGLNSTAKSKYEIYRIFTGSYSSAGVSYKDTNSFLTSAIFNSENENTATAKLDKDDAGNVKYYTRSTASDDWTENTSTDISLDATIVTKLGNLTSKFTDLGSVEINGAKKYATVDVGNFGYYYITTNTGSAVIINTTNKAADVVDKNVISTVDKVAGSSYTADAKKAIAAVGSNQSFTVQIKKKHGATKITYKDTMTNMTFNKSSLTVKVNNSDVTSSNYTVTGEDGAYSFSIAFTDDYIKGLEDDTVITLNYTAKITSDALQTNPATNTASIVVDNGDEIKDEVVNVYNGKITVTKTDGDGNALTGAGFKLKNSDGKYYTVTGEGTNKVVSWGDTGTEVMANTGGNSNVAVFSGLPAGKYTLEETTIPDGYNKAADKTFTISDNTYTEANLSQSATVENNKGNVLPSTGGIGTTIFYTIGGLVVAGAVVALVMRRRRQA